MPAPLCDEVLGVPLDPEDPSARVRGLDRFDEGIAPRAGGVVEGAGDQAASHVADGLVVPTVHECHAGGTALPEWEAMYGADERENAVL